MDVTVILPFLVSLYILSSNCITLHKPGAYELLLIEKRAKTVQPCPIQSWAWALEKSSTRPSFFCIFEKSGINEATDLAVSQLQGSTITIISAHVPGLHIWARAGPGPSSSSPKQWKSDVRLKIYNSASARSPLTKSKKENIIARAAL